MSTSPLSIDVYVAPMRRYTSPGRNPQAHQEEWL
jgi:hypothetical protein